MATDKHTRNLQQAVARYRAATKELDEARTMMIERVRAATDDGVRQADIVRAIDHEWTREHIRKLTKDDE